MNGTTGDPTHVRTAARADDVTRVLSRSDAEAARASAATSRAATSGAATPGAATPGAATPAAADAASPTLLAPTVLPPGTRVAEFEITRLIGQGGFGIVYEAWDHTLERVVALKEYLPSALATRASDGSIVPLSERQRETFDLGMRSFINEARLLAQFDHPSLVKVYRFWEERGTTYMVMPCYRGRTLRQALATDARGGAPQAWLLGIVDGVTQALAVMHAAQCYHRDIAPDNIMLLDGSDRPVVLDFGAARRVITDRTQAITVILKPGYAPIEQYAEMPDMKQGAWTDVYALAAVMHLAITTRVPPPSVGRMLSDGYAPLAQDPDLAGRYARELLEAVDAGLAVRPGSRPQSMAEFRALLGLGETASNAGSTLVIPTPPMPAAERVAHGAEAPRRYPWIPVLGVSTLLVLAGALGWWIHRDEPASDAAGIGFVTEAPGIPSAPVPSQPSVPTGQPESAQPVPASPAVEAPAPPSSAPSPRPPSVPRSPEQSLQALALGAAPDFRVEPRPDKAQVTIGKDRLGFQVSSNRPGFVYVFLLDSQRNLFLLFPNALDKRNQIAAGQTIGLPRPAWAMESGGPAGVNRFAVVVSALERDFTQSGVLAEGMFAQFPAPVLAALESARGDGPTPLLGRAICPDGKAHCADVYGVAHFEITEK